MQSGDYEGVQRALSAQRAEVMHGLLLEDIVNDRIGSVATPQMLESHPEANWEAVQVQMLRRNWAMDDVLQKHGWSEIEAFGNDIVKLYKERNKTPLAQQRPGMSEQELADLQWQLQPVDVDPNEIATYRQRLAKIQADLRPFGGDVFTDPRTARIAQILQNSAEAGRPGYLKDSEQDVNQQMNAFTRYVGVPVLEGVEAAAQGFVDLGVGTRNALVDIGLLAADSISGGQGLATVNAPTSWVQDSDGTWYHNGGKVTGLDLFAGLWQQLTGQMVDQAVARYQNDKAEAVQQARGAQAVANGVGFAAGTIFGFMKSGGPQTMAAGRALTGGLGVLATGGRLGRSLPRVAKMTGWMLDNSGAAATLALREAITSGNVEGYGAAMVHGATMALPLMLLGQLGDKLERTLMRYKHLPGFLQRSLAGTVEGIGFDVNTWEAAWQFVKDPGQRTGSELMHTVLVNSIANGILRGTGVTSNVMHDKAAGVRPNAIGDAAAAVQRGEVPAMATERGVSTESVESLGTAATEMRANVGVEPARAAEAQQRVQDAEQRMRVEETGHALSHSEKLKQRYATREELKKLRAEPDSPEKRQKIIDLLNRSRLAFGKDFAAFVKNVAEKEDLKQQGEIEAGKQILEASDVVKALLGDRAASSFRRERAQRLETRRALEEAPSEVVEGKEARPIEPVDKPSPEMARREAERRLGQEPDPLEDPRFLELPEAQQQILLDAKDTLERKRLWREMAPERRVAERRAPQPEVGATPEDLKQFDRRVIAGLELDKEARRAERRGLEEEAQLEFEEAGPGREEWKLRDKEGRLIGGGSLTHEGGKAQIWSAEIREGHRGKGLYQRVLREILKRFPNGVESIDQSEDAQRAWAKVRAEEQEIRAPDDKKEGVPASLRMRPDLETEGVPGTPKTRLSDVRAELEGRPGDAVYVPIRKGVGIRGRFSTKGVLGWYHTREKVMRIKDGQQIAIAAHEFAHAMDDQLGEPAIPLDIMPDLLNVAANWYPGFDKLDAGSQRSEAWAEFWARYMLRDPELRADAGRFYDWAMDWLASPKLDKFRVEFQRKLDVIANYIDQGSVLRGEARFKWFDDAKTVQELRAEGVFTDTPLNRARAAMKRVWREIDKALGDDLREMRRSQREVLESLYGGPEGAQAAIDKLPITADPVRLMQALRFTASKQAERFLVEGTHDIAGRPTGESLKDIQDQIGGTTQQQKDFWNWYFSKQELEMIAKKKPTILSEEDNLAIVEKLEQPHYEQIAERVKMYADRVIDYGVEGGLFSQEQAVNIKTGYRYYFPLQRILKGPSQFAAGRGVAERGTGVRSRKGSWEEVLDPLTALGNYTRVVIQKTHQAMAVKAAVKFGVLTEGAGGFITEVRRDAIPDQHPIADVLKAINAAAENSPAATKIMIEDATELIETLAKNGDMEESITLFEQQVVPKGSRAVISARIHFSEDELAQMTKQQRQIAEDKNGKLLWLEMDLNAFHVLKGLDVPPSVLDHYPAVAWAFEKGAQMQRFGAVAISMGFQLRNLVRDTLTSLVYTDQKRTVSAAIGRAVKGAVDMWNRDPVAMQYEAMGGGVSTYYAGEVARGRSAEYLMGVQRGIVARARKAVHDYADLMSKTESFLRYKAFRFAQERALQAGELPIDAALEALEAAKQEVTDLTRGGVLIHTLNRIIPFTRANIAGTRQFLTHLSGAKGRDAQLRALAVGFTRITIPTLALWWLNKGEEWYQELPEWERSNYWHLKFPGVDEPVRWPKPFELGKIMGNVPESVADMIFSEHPIGVGETMWDVATSLVPSRFMNPTVEAFLGNLTNHNFFTGREIVPDWMERSRLPSDQRTAYTRWYANMIADALKFTGIELSPMKIEYTLDTATGGLIGRGADLFRQVTSLAGALDSEGFSAKEIPVLGTLFSRPFSQSRSVQEIYDLDSELERMAGSQRLTSEQQRARRLVGDAKDRISDLKKAAKNGAMTRVEADRQAADIAREALRRIQK